MLYSIVAVQFILHAVPIWRFNKVVLANRCLACSKLCSCVWPSAIPRFQRMLCMSCLKFRPWSCVQRWTGLGHWHKRVDSTGFSPSSSTFGDLLPIVKTDLVDVEFHLEDYVFMCSPRFYLKSPSSCEFVKFLLFYCCCYIRCDRWVSAPGDWRVMVRYVCCSLRVSVSGCKFVG